MRFRFLFFFFCSISIANGLRKRQVDQTPNLIQEALNKFYHEQFQLKQLPAPRRYVGYCRVSAIENVFYMADIIGMVSSSLNREQCVSACLQNSKCLSVNHLPTHSKCVLLASGLNDNDVWRRSLRDTFYSTRIQSQHLMLQNCVDEYGRTVIKKQPPQPTTIPPQPPVLNEVCGVPYYQPIIPMYRGRQRITGGDEAAAHSWPWLVSLQADGSHTCGATLLPVSDDQSDIVLTAAHCVTNSDGSPIQAFGLSALLGSHSVNVVELGEQNVPVIRILVHNEYEPRNMFGDVALLKLYSPVKYSRTITPICLARSGEAPSVTDTCIVSGWGNVNEINDEVYPERLQQLKVPVPDDNICTRSDVWTRTFNTTAMTCTGYLSGKRNVCSGDSGGPLVCGSNGRWVQYGVASFVSSDGCQVAKKPGVFAKVGTYQQWIVNNAKRMTSVKRF